MNTYHRRFLETRSASNVIDLFCRYRGGAKEITESWGMLEAFKKYGPANSAEARVIVIGDGRTPRTGAMIAYYTRAEVFSFDPAFNLRHIEDWANRQVKLGEPPRRLVWHDFGVEHIKNMFDMTPQKYTVIIWPHSHADMNTQIVLPSDTKRIDIAMPCCVQIPSTWMRIPHIMYEDKNICSPKNKIHVWLERWDNG